MSSREVSNREMKLKRNRARRARQLRIRISVAAAASLLIFAILFAFTSFNSKAQESSERVDVKYYSSVMIPYGTTLSELSEEYYNADHYDSFEDYLDEVKYINHMTDCNIQAGQYIILPYYETL